MIISMYSDPMSCAMASWIGTGVGAGQPCGRPSPPRSPRRPRRARRVPPASGTCVGWGRRAPSEDRTTGTCEEHPDGATSASPARTPRINEPARPTTNPTTPPKPMTEGEGARGGFLSHRRLHCLRGIPSIGVRSDVTIPWRRPRRRRIRSACGRDRRRGTGRRWRPPCRARPPRSTPPTAASPVPGACGRPSRTPPSS